MTEDIDVYHEPALKEDGTLYRPNILDDSGDLYSYSGFLCRHCHVFYADPEAKGGKLMGKIPVEIRDRSDAVCPTRMLEAISGMLGETLSKFDRCESEDSDTFTR